MRQLTALIFTATASLAAADSFRSDVDKPEHLVPQARPVATWLEAVKNGDKNRLKTVFSEKIRSRFDAEGWDKVMKTYQQVFKQEFGDYKLEDFKFEFTGDEEKGKVSVVHQGKKTPGLRVVKEKSGWKVNER